MIIDSPTHIFEEYIQQAQKLDLTPELSFIELCRFVFSHCYERNTLSLADVDGIIPSAWEVINYFDKNKLPDMRIFSQVYDHYLNQSIRDKTGSYYTPDYVIKYMIETSLITYLSKKTTIEKECIYNFIYDKKSLSLEKIEQMLDALSAISVLDLSCGTGLFLILAFEKILYIKKKMLDLMDIRKDDYLIKKEILEQNLYGIDIQQYPIEIAKMTLLSMLYGPDENRLREVIKVNLHTGDSLTEEIPNKDGWPQVFDIVIGNPPYLGEKGNQEIFRKYRSTSFGGKYYEGKMDLFYYFIYRALEILKDGGLLSYITTNYFVTADGAQQLREYLKKHTTFLHVVNFNHTSLFSSARGQHNMIFLLAKGKETDEKMFLKLFPKKYLSPPSIEKGLYEREKHGHITHNHHLKNSNLFDRRGYILINGSNDEQLLLEKIDGGCDRRLRELCHINQGIVSGADRVTKNILNNKLSEENIKQYDILVNDGIFVLQKKEVLALGLQDSAYIKPMFKNSDIQSYQVKEDTEKFLLYIKDGQLDNIESEEEERIFKHLLKYRDILKLRREVKQGLRSWYALQCPRQQEIFEKPKIVVPHRTGENRFAYTNIPWYASADVYFITAKASHIDLRHLLIQLNSKLMYFWLYYRGKRKGSDLELYANPLKELPVCINHMEHKNILKMVNTIIKSKGQQMREAIDAYVYSCYQLEPKEIQKIEELYSSNRR